MTLNVTHGHPGQPGTLSGPWDEGVINGVDVLVEVGGREDEFEELTGLVLSLGGIGTEGGVGVQGVGVDQGDVEVQEGLVIIDLHH